MSPTFVLDGTFEIEGRAIGDGKPVFVIAEIGVNHNGDLALAKECVRSAASCGVDAVKFQTFRAEEFMADRELVYTYESGGGIVQEKMFDMFKRLELPAAWHEELFVYARAAGVVPLTSVADAASADMVAGIGAGALKLSSEDFINLPLMEHAARSGIPLLLSTGMADEEEVDDVLAILGAARCHQACFLHCVSVYPTRDEEVGLRRMRAIKEKVCGPVGYSDHSLGIEACVGAVALGACVLEKHFTLDRALPGPDHALSSDPAEMRRLVEAVRRTERMLGDGRIAPSVSERETRSQFRRSVVAARALKRGHVIGRDDLQLKRPGTGLRAREMPMLLGGVLRRDIGEDEIILPTDIGRRGEDHHEG